MCAYFTDATEDPTWALAFFKWMGELEDRMGFDASGSAKIFVFI
jgi:hypothetical protein